MEYTFHIQDFWTTCACPEKQRVPWIHYIECVFYYSGFLSNLRLPWKFSLYWIFFLLFWIFEQLALALKNRVALEFFTVLKYILLFRIFEELVVALKTEFALTFFKPGGAAAPTRLVRLCLQVLPFVHNVGCGLRHALKLSWLTLVTASRLVLLPARAIVGHKITQVAEVDDFFEPSSVHEDTCLRCIGVRLLVHHNVFFRYCWRVIYSRSAPPYLCFFLIALDVIFTKIFVA